ncbi:hypothetical protein NX801_17830 [Streptomyces sp. LP05-1]|uniref:Regulator protein n=1 Tax=Streptomyces pyxinae TaxID=2970734 RepID=A0ABT2CJA0_9ACTN|nr:hypothetical protein [Streptomyces sp. LP05-1]MCS0637491.1 hypothetical protein [Streptomyces sp. LP05-1]
MTYQVPPQAAHFVDREGERAKAFRALTERDGRARPLCLALSGLGGTGRTELAFELVREVSERYPDGVLYADLDDLRRDGAVDTGDVLTRLLRALDVPPEWIEGTFKNRCTQYWSKTHGKRLIVVLDNARTAAEVVPLLPSSGDSLVLVTSQGPLYELERGAVVELPLAPLADEHAGELLRRLADDPRLPADPELTGRILRLCSGLPAALHVAAGWLRRHRRRPLDRLVRELTADLHDRGVPVVEGLWDAACAGLGPDAAALYRLLAVHPAPAVPVASAVALLGRGPEATDDAVDELEAAGLLSVTGEWLRLPELLRAHARRWADRTGDPREAAEAFDRLAHWYLRQAQRADLLVAGARLVLAPRAAALPGTPDAEFTGEDGAREWLEEAAPALHGCVRAAHARGLDTLAWSLCEPLWTHHLDFPHPRLTEELYTTGLAAALRAGDSAGAVRMCCQAARSAWESGDLAGAARLLDRAESTLPLLDATPPHRKLGASVTEFRGMLLSARAAATVAEDPAGAHAEWARAAQCFQSSRAIHLALENAYGVLVQTYRWGEVAARLGDLERAAALLTEAYASAAADRRGRLTGRIQYALAGVEARRGHREEAGAHYLAALDRARARRAGREEERVLIALAGYAEEGGDPAGAERYRELARAVRERNGGLA